MAIKVRLKELAARAGVKSLEKLGKDTGCSEQTIYDLANNKKNAIRFDHLENLCLQLGCTPGDLLELAPAESSAQEAGHGAGLVSGAQPARVGARERNGRSK